MEGSAGRVRSPEAAPRTVFVTAYPPARTGGAGLRTCGIVQALAAHAPVEVHWAAFGDAEPAADLVADPDVELHRVLPGRGAARARAVLAAVRQGAPLDLARSASPELRAAGAGAGSRDRVIADGLEVCAALLGLARRRPVIYCARNVESQFRGDARLERFERRVLRTVAETWMVTPADVADGRRLAGDDRLAMRAVPNVVDVARIAPVRPQGGHRVLFVADFTYAPNRDALAFLVDDVLPRVWAADPGARLVLVGRGLDEPPVDPRIDVRGFVDDLEAVYAEVDAVVVPLRQGGGSPLKFVEALAHALPVVTTTHAAALLEEGEAGRDFAAGADAEAVADGIVRALAGELGTLGPAGRALAERAYSVQSLMRLLAPQGRADAAGGPGVPAPTSTD